MFKPYDNQEAIPAEFKEHYSRREDGKWHADIPNDHPAVKHNAKLLSEKQEAETKATKLEGDLESAKASGLPRGHVAIPKADAELVEKLKAHGTADEITAKLTEHKDLKEKVAKQEQRARLVAAGKAAGYGDNAADVLALIPDLPEVELRDGKDAKGEAVKLAVAKVKGADSTVTEKPLADYIAETHPALLPSLQGDNKQSGGTSYVAQPPGGRAPQKNIFEGIREEVKKKEESKQARSEDLHPMFKRQEKAA